MNYQWKVVNHEVVFQGYFRIEKYDLDHEKYAGGMTGRFQREIFERGSAVAVIPYDPVRDQVVLIEQFRAGAIGSMDPPWMKEIVAGIIEPDESQSEVANRETLEEAGCKLLELEKISQYFVSPGGTTEQCALYYGRVESEGVGGIHGLEHEFEDIRVEVVGLEQANTWVQDGTINSAASIIGIQWLMLNRERLRNPSK